MARYSEPKRYYVGRSVDHVRERERPPLVLQGYLEHQVKTGVAESFEDALSQFSERTGIPKGRLEAILAGDLPTSLEIDTVCERLGWSHCMIFGISKDAMDCKSRWYFNEMGIEEPSAAQEAEFRRLYEELLRMRGDSADSKEGI